MTKKTTKKIANIPIPLAGFDKMLSTIHGTRIKYGVMDPKDELEKSSRSDYGRVIDIRIPHGFHAQVKKSWEMYETDRLFRYLIERCIDFGANGFEWELPLPDLGPKTNFWKKFKKLFKGDKPLPSEKEKKVWDMWSARINESAANVIPGLDEVNQWIFKHFLLGAMAPLEWQWEKIEIDGKEYELPMKITVHNPLSIVLDRKNVKFTEEETFLVISSSQRKILETNKSINLATLYSADGNLPDRIKLNQMGISTKNKQEAFVLKYRWSPGDNTALVYGRNVQTGQGLYPTPPFVGLYEVLLLRKQLHASDIAILDGIINFIIDWEIGDTTVIKDRHGAEHLINQPRPERILKDGTREESSIALAKKIITSDTRGPVMQIFHPYYFKLSIKMPEVTSLINAEKYDPTLFELYQAFGILVSGRGRAGRFAEADTQNFEAMLENLRQKHVKRFWESLCTLIVKRNKDKLKIIPNFIWDPLPTKNSEYQERLFNIAKTGKISTDTLLSSLGLDKRSETAKIAREVYGGEKDLFDLNVPISFVQTNVNPSKGRKVTAVSAQEGRPKGSKKDESEVEEEEE